MHEAYRTSNDILAMSQRVTVSVPKRLRNVLCLDDFEAHAARLLPRAIYTYLCEAVERRHSAADNRASIKDHLLLPRVLQDVSHRDSSVELFGERYAQPFGIAPMGLAALSAFRGDVILAQSAAEAGIVSVMSGASLIPMETVANAAPRTWFQAYLPVDSARVDRYLARVEEAGFRVLVLTVDMPVAASPENMRRGGFSAPLEWSPTLIADGMTHPRWLLGTLLRTLAAQGMPCFENSFAEPRCSPEGNDQVFPRIPLVSRKTRLRFAARDALTWRDVHHVRSRWSGPLVVKGILGPQDAVLAREGGADAIVLSNHGGRRLDSAVSALRQLETVVDALDGFPVLIDGGFRRGTDVLKALCLGARMVLVGRPFNYALATAGACGVRHAIDLLATEVDRDLALLGVGSCTGLTRERIVRRFTCGSGGMTS
ncbi:alpha-hydroxy-acid oxidizing enzyme [Burkholderia sp. SG-MS1]|uniref:alpha-hydroxy acid oxidase n=1 Tax=Paraburkholderia sp. SG-MS1 TaxID=2023741 RepID=UPI00157FDA7F|nr:alpha-hydroxy acid oxidase [Paraburkholderia sp. SG-MS1]NKJ45614.1 alpha-hydroxy-acid oxidizing enzyme [Paraburkholderia sp. SG-MS1]